MIPSFDFLAYVESRCQVTRRYGRGEHMLRECPHCKAREHCSVNPRTQKWRCYRCTWAGSDPIYFVAEVESCDLSAARELVLSSNLVQRRPEELQRILKGAQEKKVEPAKRLGGDWRVAMPKEYIPCYDRGKGKWNGVPTYLKERGITKETCLLFRLGWCDTGRYAHRIIIPMSAGDVHTFQARATWDEAVPKYLGEIGAPLSKVLMGYDMLRKGDELWVVEGPFDKLACHQAGIPAVPLTGKELSDQQINLIVRLAPPRVHVMLDPDAEVMVRRTAAKLSYRVSTDIVLLKGGDPGELRDELRVQARQFHESSRPSLAKILAKASTQEAQR